MEKERIEIFDFLRKNNSINDVDINDLSILFQNYIDSNFKEKRYKNLEIKKVINGSLVIIFDTNLKKNKIFGCVSEFFNIIYPNTSFCHKIIEGIFNGNENNEKNCVKCYINCIDKFNDNDITLRNRKL